MTRNRFNGKLRTNVEGNRDREERQRRALAPQFAIPRKPKNPLPLGRVIESDVKIQEEEETTCWN